MVRYPRFGGQITVRCPTSGTRILWLFVLAITAQLLLGAAVASATAAPHITLKTQHTAPARPTWMRPVLHGHAGSEAPPAGMPPLLEQVLRRESRGQGHHGLSATDMRDRRLPARRTSAGSHPHVRLAPHGAASHVSAASLPQQAELLVPGGIAGDAFGTAVAVSGATAVIGAPGRGGNNTGAAYVFTRSGTTWSLQQVLTATDGAPNNYFGFSVAISGSVMLIGAYGKNTNTGAVYVFTRSGTTWTQQAELTASGGTGYEVFGYSVALSGNTALIGAPGSDTYGAAYVFVGGGATWTQQAKLTAGDPDPDSAGWAVALDGDTAVVGAPTESDQAPNSGEMFAYMRSGTTWTPQTEIGPGTSGPGDYFGTSVAVNGNTALIGAPGVGATYVYTRSGAAWSQQVTLPASGNSVALVGNTAVVGAINDNGGTGAAYIFTGSGATWSGQQELLGADAFAGDEFGAAVAFDGSSVAVGAPAKGGKTGAAYIFSNGTTPVCPTDVWEGLPYLNRYDNYVDNGSGVCVKTGYTIHDSTFTAPLTLVTTSTNIMEANVSAVTMTIPAGASLQASSGGLYITSTLTAPGTAASPIALTAPSTGSVPGAWRGIAIRPGGSGTFSYVHLSYAGGTGLIDSTGDTHQAGLLVEGAGLTLTNSTIDHSAGNAVEVMSGANPTLSGDTFTGNAGWAVVYNPGSLPTTFGQDSALSASGNGHDAVGFPGGTVNGSWDTSALGIPLQLTGDVTVAGLTLTPGSSLAMAANLYVTGALTLNGTAKAPITLTSASTTPAPGNWGGIAFRPGSSGTLSYVHESFAGGPGLTDSTGGTHQAAVLVEGASPSITNSTIDNSAGSGVEVMGGGNAAIGNDTFAGIAGPYGVQVDDVASLPTLSNDTLTNCAVRVSPDGVDLLSGISYGGSGLAIDVLGGNMAASDSWPNLGLPYRVLSDLAVPAGATLALPAPATVRFSGGALYVAGTLNAQGTATTPITLTAPSGATTPGSWRGIAFRPGSSGTLTYVQLSFAGGPGLTDSMGGTHQAALLVEGASPRITNSTISSSAGYGLEVIGGSPAVSHDAFTGNNSEALHYEALQSTLTLVNSALSASGNGFDGIGLAAGSISGTVTLVNPGVGLRTDGTISVNAGAQLTVATGLMQVNGGLTVAGMLTLTGTATTPLSVTTASGSLTPGSWGGVTFQPGSSGTLNDVHLSFAGAGGGPAILVSGASPRITNSTIDESAGNGLEIAGGAPTLAADRFTNNAGWPIQYDGLPPTLSLVNNGLLASGNNPGLGSGQSGNVIHFSGGGTIAQTWTLQNLGLPLRFDQNAALTIAAGARLSAGPSTQVLFGTNGGIAVYGTLSLSGTAASPIALSSYTVPGSAGQWSGLTFDPGSQGLLNHVHLSYAGCCGNNPTITIDGAGPAIINSSITSGAGNGLEITASGGNPTLAGDSFIDNAGNAVQFDFLPGNLSRSLGGLSAGGNADNAVVIPGGTYGVTGTWPDAGIPYHVQSDLTIDSSLTLGAGATLKECPGCQLGVFSNGTLTVSGTASSPVTLTSAAASPAPGDWAGLCLDPGTATLAYAHVSYAGNAGGSPSSHCGASLGHGAAIAAFPGSSLSVTGASIDHSAGNGVELNIGASLTNDSFTKNMGEAVQYDFVPGDLSTLGGLSTTGNGDDAVGIAGGSDAGAGTWPNLGIPYHLENDVGINGNLTIGAGATLKECPGCQLGVFSNGTLTVSGTASSPVTLTSAAASPAPGDWAGLCLDPGTATVTYLHLFYAGNAGGSPNSHCGASLGHGAAIAAFPGSSFGMTNTLVENTAGNGVDISAGAAVPTLAGDTISDDEGRPLQFEYTPADLRAITGLRASSNGDNAVGIAGGSDAGAGTWPNLGIPYHLDSDLSIAGNLTVGAGATLKECPGCQLGVFSNGTLTVSGTASSPVTLTSAAASPAPGDWAGLCLDPGTATLAYAHVSYAGNAGGSPSSHCGASLGHGAAIAAFPGSSLSVTGASIDHSAGDDVTALNAAATLRSSSLLAVSTGSYGVANDGGGTVDSAYNWWGDPSGPSGAGPGSGTPVSAGVSFTPWLTTAPGATTLAASPATVRPFQTASITGTNFVPGEAVTLYWDSSASAPLTTTTANAGGSFTTRIVVPQTPAGQHTLLAVGQSSALGAGTTLTVVPDTFLYHTTGVKGSVNGVVGFGFGSGETVRAYWLPGSQILGQASTNGQGTVTSLTFTVPLSPTGTYYITSVGLRTHAIAVSTFTITAARSSHVRSMAHGAPTSPASDVGAARTLTRDCGPPGCMGTTVMATRTHTVAGRRTTLRQRRDHAPWRRPPGRR